MPINKENKLGKQVSLDKEQTIILIKNNEYSITDAYTILIKNKPYEYNF